MRIFNTLTMSKEEFEPLVPGRASIYCCGPTVYNFIHVGNARPLIVFDVLRRYLRHTGYSVRYVQNYTDIDDKVINLAAKEGVTYENISERYIAEFETDARGLGVLPADKHPRATEHIGDIIALVGTLAGRGYAYTAPDGVYFRVRKFGDYGKLSHQPLDELEAGARVGVDTGKEDPMDFALWKFEKPGEPSWDSPWGKGRPGWHIECSAMAGALLGDTVDIHCGGQDLVFPHHENEIAQSEAAHGRPFARYWMHNGFLSVDSRKMSKSLGNFFTVREAAREFGYEAIRMFMLSAHYRSPLNYSADQLTSAKSALERLYTARANLEHIRDNGREGMDSELPLRSGLAGYQSRFESALDDDLNTADAIGVLFEMVRDINAAVSEHPYRELAAECLNALSLQTGLLGLLYGGRENIDSGIEALIEVRQKARSEKNWAEADRIRDELKALGVILEDTPLGIKWRKI